MHFLYWKWGFSTLFSLVFPKILPANSGLHLAERCVLPPWPPAAVALAGGWWCREPLPPTSKFLAFFHPQKKVKKTYQPWQKIVFCLEDDVVFFCGYCRFQHLTKELAAHTGHDTPRIKGHVIYLFTNPSHSPCFVGPGHSLHPLGEDEWTCFNVIKIQSSDPKLRGAI